MLPARTLDTMSTAIAIASPNGRMSKRAKDAAVARLGRELFGDGSCFRAPEKAEDEKRADQREMLLRHATRLRDLASRGMSVRKFIKEAARAEAQAAAL